MAAAIWSAHALVQVFSSVMSFISSMLIACTVAWPGNGGLSTPFRRIIFGLSSCYIIVSVALISGPWMVPRSVGVEYDFWGIGNKTTCQAAGFLFTVGTPGTAFYTCVLCLYYLAKLKWKMTDNTIWHRYEKKIHLFFITYRIAVGVAALSLDLLHTGVNGAVCAVALTPYGCRHEPELVGECTNNRSTVNVFIFFDIFLTVLLVFVFIIATMITLILHAYFLKKLNEREIALSVAEDGSSRHDFGLDIDTEPNNARNPETIDESSESTYDGKKSIGNATLWESQSTGAANTLPQRTLPQRSLEQENDSKTGKLERQARAQAASDLSRLYFNETMLQAKLYVGCFILSYIPIIFILIAITATNSSAREDNSLLVTILAFFVVFFYPFGGFMNIFVYSRPNVARLRRLHPEISRLKAFWMVLRAGGEVASVENSEQSSDNQLARYNSPERKRKISHSTKDPFGVARIVAGREDILDFVSSDVAMNGRSETFAEGDPRFAPPSDWSYEEGGNSNLNLPSFSDDQGEGRGKHKNETEMGRRRGGKVSSFLAGLSFFSEETKNNNSNLSFASREMGLDSEDWKSKTQST